MDKDVQLTASIIDNGARREIDGIGNGPISAFCNALKGLGVNLQVLDYYEHAMSSGGDAKAASYLECEIQNGSSAKSVYWGVGIDPSTTTASLKAIISAVNRALR
jgi:2-isopropylmalate synthase